VTLLNPFDVDPAAELAQDSTGEPLWTEFCFFFAYDPDADAGVSIHAGREPADPSIWRVTIGLMLPGGVDLLMAKRSGRDGDGRGAGAAGFKATCVEPLRLWTIGYDGSMIRCPRDELCRAAAADDIGELASFQLSFEGVGPMWDLRKKMPSQSWASGHWEQICRVRGEVRVNGETLPIRNGFGVRDHSYGPRDYDGVLGNFWANALFEDGRAVMMQHTVSQKLSSEIRHGYVFWNNGSPLEVVELVEAPEVSNLGTPDGHETADPLAQESLRRSRAIIRTSRGDQTIAWELLHSVPTTYVAPSDEVIGTDFRRPDALQLTESVARFRWEGETAYGNRERVAGVRTLRPSP
jgi:hypothetical protein